MRVCKWQRVPDWPFMETDGNYFRTDCGHTLGADHPYYGLAYLHCPMCGGHIKRVSMSTRVQCTKWGNGLIVENDYDGQVRNWYQEGRDGHETVYLTRQEIESLPDFSG